MSDDNCPSKKYPDGRTGDYYCRCILCNGEFIGHKRDHICPRPDCAAKEKQPMTNNESAAGMAGDSVEAVIAEMRAPSGMPAPRSLVKHWADRLEAALTPSPDAAAALEALDEWRAYEGEDTCDKQADIIRAFLTSCLPAQPGAVAGWLAVHPREPHVRPRYFHGPKKPEDHEIVWYDVEWHALRYAAPPSPQAKGGEAVSNVYGGGDLFQRLQDENRRLHQALVDAGLTTQEPTK